MKSAVPASLTPVCSHPVLAYVVDPWGAAIDMTESLAPDTH